MARPPPRRRPRPFPSSHALAAINPQRPRALPPILVDFLRALGKEEPPAPSGNSNHNNPPAAEPPARGGDEVQAAPLGRALRDDHAASLIANDEATRTGRLKRSAHEFENASVPGASHEEGVDQVSLDSSAHSTLTDLQHQRFLQLSLLLEERSDKPVSTWREATRKEYHKLVKLVKKEQELYRQALALFWTSNPLERLSLGFEDGGPEAASAAGPFVEAARQSKQRHVEAWREWVTGEVVPRRYGKVRQVIALDVDDQFAALSLDAIVPLVIQPDANSAETSEVPAPSVPAANQERVPPGSVLAPPMPEDCGATMARLGDEALELAALHKADLATTEETLRSLLRLLARETTSTLLVPASRATADAVVRLEAPVPEAFASPRECLEVGVEVALRQILERPSTHGPNPDSGNPSFGYTLLNVPCRTRPPLRVLVRRTCRDGAPPAHPFRRVPPRARVEYFPERGPELAAAVDRALWVTDHLLDGRSEDAAIAICHVDPSTMKCVGWETASWASATTEPSRWFERTDQRSVVDHWRRLASLLSGTSTIAAGQHLLVFPGKIDAALSTPLSVTVHESEEGGEIDLMAELELCDSLPLGPDEFARCQRYWKWESEKRAPYTFPVARPSHSDAPNLH